MNVNIDFAYDHLNALFNINFTMLAFMITALTILQMIQTGRIEEFKKVGIFDDVLKYFHKSLVFHSISGLCILILWFFQLHDFYKTFATITSFILFFIAFYYTYKSYSFLVYFIKKQDVGV